MCAGMCNGDDKSCVQRWNIAVQGSADSTNATIISSMQAFVDTLVLNANLPEWSAAVQVQIVSTIDLSYMVRPLVVIRQKHAKCIPSGRAHHV